MAKVRQNLAAIRLAKHLEAEARPATPDDQSVLAKYTGWGSLGSFFDVEHADYEKAEGRELRTLLTPDEYAEARSSVQNADYTSPEVVRAMWDVLAQAGLHGGRALEPSVGVGNFIGFGPQDLAWTAIEKDPVTGLIAKHLYPQADVHVAGFEDVPLRNGSFDVAVSNVPFGQVKVYDPAYRDLRDWSIHNFFLAKSIDKVRPGGIVMAITSRWTLDGAKTENARRYLRDRADLLAAVRLPRTAFKANAGTEVVTDILVFRVREKGEKPNDVAWMGLAPISGPNRHGDQSSAPVNEYFAQHPEMVLGSFAFKRGQHSDNDLTVEPDTRSALGDQIREALTHALPSGALRPRSAQSRAEQMAAIDAPPESMPESLVLKGGVIYKVALDRTMQPATIGQEQQQKVKRLILLRDLARKLVTLGANADTSDEEVARTRADLEALYRAFVERYGPVNRTIRTEGTTKHGKRFVRTRHPNWDAFKADPGLAFVLALERYDEENDSAEPADLILRGRILAKTVEVTSVDTALEAVSLSLVKFGRLDLDYMAGLRGVPASDLLSELGTAVYEDPATGEWDIRPRYLSGNVVQKLEVAEKAAERDRRFQRNVEALRNALPAPLPPELIKTRLGAPWIPVKDYRAFIGDLLGVPTADVDLKRSPMGRWSLDVRSLAGAQSVQNRSTYGTADMPATEIIRNAMNSRAVRVTRTDPHTKQTSVDEAASALADAKRREIEVRFRAWLFTDDADRAHRMIERFNHDENAIAPPNFKDIQYDPPGTATHINGKSFAWFQHQRTAIVRFILNGSELLAHAPGGGKTYAFIAMAMEARRLGLAKRPMIVVPNHMLEQATREAQQLYPWARILSLSSDDTSGKAKAALAAKAAMDSWDLIITTHVGVGRIPMSKAAQAEFIKAEIADLLAAIKDEDTTNRRGEKKSKDRSVAQIEAMVDKLEARLKVIMDKPTDTQLTFEELGVDLMVVDEAHEFKNLNFPTRIEGFSAPNSQRAFQMYMKTRYLHKINPTHGVVFATGTPVTNKISELWTMTRYVSPKSLSSGAVDLSRFDDWAAMFGQVVTRREKNTVGQYVPKARLARYMNTHSMIQQFREFADIMTAQEMALPRPPLLGGAFKPVLAPRPEGMPALLERLQRDWERLKHMPPVERLASGISFLSIGNRARLAGLDMRLVDANAPDDFPYKVRLAADKIQTAYRDHAAHKGVQVVFLDQSIDRGANALNKTGGRMGFSVYAELKRLLIERGIPEHEIAFTQNAGTVQAKAALFKATREGRVRVLVGSTSQMGIGTNIQDRLVALHRLDVPWRPDQIEQSEARILRMGNKLYEAGKIPGVEIFRYVTEGSYDQLMWDTVLRKAKANAQAMAGDPSIAELDEMPDETAQGALLMAAVAANDPLEREMVDLQQQVAELSAEAIGFQHQVAHDRNELKGARERIAWLKKRIAYAEQDEQAKESTKGDLFKIDLVGKTYTKRADAAVALHNAVTEGKKVQVPEGDSDRLGRFGGFDLLLVPILAHNQGQLFRAWNLQIAAEASVDVRIAEEDSGTSMLSSLEYALREKVGAPERFRPDLATNEQRAKDLAEAVKRTWGREADLTAARKRLDEIDTELLARSKQKPPETIAHDEDLSGADDEASDDSDDEDTDTEGPAGVAERGPAYNAGHGVQAAIAAALAALAKRDLNGTRQAIAVARRALGNWGGGPIRDTDALDISLLTATPRDTLASWLAVAADALSDPSRDTWPGDEPYHVAEWLKSEEYEEPSRDVAEWIGNHGIIQDGMARVALKTALNMAAENRIAEQGPKYNAGQAGLFGDEPAPTPGRLRKPPAAPSEQETMFAGREGTRGNIADAEKAARAELIYLEQEAKLIERALPGAEARLADAEEARAARVRAGHSAGGKGSASDLLRQQRDALKKRAVAIVERTALLRKLVDRGAAITPEEMAVRARAAKMVAQALGEEPLDPTTFDPDRAAETLGDALGGQGKLLESGPSYSSSPEPLARFRNDEEGTEARVYKHDRGYSVSLLDTDADEVVPSITIFPTLEAAVANAQKVAGPAAHRLAETSPTYAAAARPRFYSRLERAIERAPFPRGTAAQWSAALSKDVAKGEREWTGVDRFLKDNALAALPKYEEYTEPGGTNYRELLVQLGRHGGAHRIEQIDKELDQLRHDRPGEGARIAALEAERDHLLLTDTAADYESFPITPELRAKVEREGQYLMERRRRRSVASERVTQEWAVREDVSHTTAQLDDVAETIRRVEAIGLPTAAVRRAEIEAAAKRGVIDLTGRRWRTERPDEGAELMAAFRHPSMEILSVVVKDADGTIRGHFALTSGARYYVAVAIPRLAHDIADLLAKVGGATVSLVHNHPSGDPHASFDDLRYTRDMGEHLRARYGVTLDGHLVINHDTANWILFDPMSTAPLADNVSHVNYTPQSAEWRAAVESGPRFASSPTALFAHMRAAAGANAIMAVHVDTQHAIVAVDVKPLAALERVGAWLPESEEALASNGVIFTVPRGHGAVLAQALSEQAGSGVAFAAHARNVLDIIEVDTNGHIPPRSFAQDGLLPAAAPVGDTAAREAIRLSAGEPIRAQAERAFGPGGRGLGVDTTGRISQANGVEAGRLSRPDRVAAPASPYRVARKAVDDAAAKAAEAEDAWRRLLNAASRGLGAHVAALALRSRAGEAARIYERAAAALEVFRKTLMQLPRDERWDFVDRVENGLPQPAPDLEKVSQAIRRELDDVRDQIRSLGLGALDHFIEHYFPHIWAKPDAAKAVLRAIARRPLEGSKSFLKRRTIPTIREGMQGFLDSDPTHTFTPLEPVSDNPLDMVLLKLHEMGRFLMAQRVVQDLKDQGLMKFERGKMEPGWSRIEDPVGSVYYRNEDNESVLAGHWVAPSPVALILNNYLSPGWQGNALYDIPRGLGNLINIVQLGLSAFHLGFTSMDAMTSRMALAVLKATQGDLLSSLSEAASTPAAAFTGVVKGDRVLREYMHPGSQGAEFAKVVELLTKAGGRVRMDSFYRVGPNSKIGVDFWTSFWRDIGNKNVLGAGWKAPFAVIQAAPHFIMEHIVPRQKLAVFADLAMHELDRLQHQFPGLAQKDPGQWDVEVKAAMARVWDSVDNRMGQLVYDNLFWHRATKDAAMLAVRSVGWNLGTFRELGGGVIDALEVPAGAVRRFRTQASGGGKGPPSGGGGTGGGGGGGGGSGGSGGGGGPNEPMPRNVPSAAPKFTLKMSYLIAAPVVAWLVGATLQYLYDGDAPGVHDDEYKGFREALYDGFYPRTGRMDPEGNPERLVLPTYLKDIFQYKRHPVTTLAHKFQSVWSIVASMVANRDFYGDQIRNEDAPGMEQVKQTLRFTGHEILPFAWQNAQEAAQRDQGVAEKAGGFVGLTVAPREAVRTPAQNLMARYLANRGHTARTPEQLESAQERRETIDRLRNAGVSENALRDSVEAAADRMGASPQKRGALRRSVLTASPLIQKFQMLDVDEAQRVYDLGQPWERRLFWPALRVKLDVKDLTDSLVKQNRQADSLVKQSRLRQPAPVP